MINSFHFRCDREKKDSDDSHDTNEKGPDIIPLSKDSEGKMCILNTSDRGVKHVILPSKMTCLSSQYIS